MSRYRPKRSSFNGIAEYLFNRYEVPRKDPKIQSIGDVNNVLVSFLTSHNLNHSNDVSVNSRTVQKRFGKFVSWCKENLKIKEANNG